MTRQTWTTIKETLADEIAQGQFSTGDKLPTEPELAARFQAGRHSVRRALEALASEGRISIEQGRGTFVEARPRLTYQIGNRTRLRRNLIPQGLEVASELIAAKRIAAPLNVSTALHLNPGAKVTESQRKTLADGLPIAFGAAYHCAERFPDFAERRDVLGSTTETYRTYGIEDYIRLSTEFYARRATEAEAKTLKQHVDVPVTVVNAVDATPDGTPISCSRVIWSAARVTFTMGTSDDR